VDEDELGLELEQQLVYELELGLELEQQLVYELVLEP
jgi:hypothetical protein